MFGLGIWELVIILVVILVFFSRKFPDIGEGLGKGIRSFRKAVRQADEIDITPTENKEKKESQEEENSS